jgi:hypothetical protein
VSTDPTEEDLAEFLDFLGPYSTTGTFPESIEDWDTVFKARLAAFWGTRDPIAYLGSVTGRVTKYIRIQGDLSHTSPPTWLEGWNAAKALQATLSSGNESLVYCADSAYTNAVYDEYRDTGVIVTGPTCLLDTSIDLNTAGADSWPDWPATTGNALLPTGRFFFVDAWQVQVDVIRWTFHMGFSSPASISTGDSAI